MGIQDLVQYPENAKDCWYGRKSNNCTLLLQKKEIVKNAYIIKGVFEYRS